MQQASPLKVLKTRHEGATQNNRDEKLPEIPWKKQAVYRDHGGGAQRCAGLRAAYRHICLAAVFCGQELR